MGTNTKGVWFWFVVFMTPNVIMGVMVVCLDRELRRERIEANQELATLYEEYRVMRAEVAGFAANMETMADKLQVGVGQMSPDNPNRETAAGVVQLHRLYGMWADRLANGLVTRENPIHATPGFCQEIK